MKIIKKITFFVAGLFLLFACEKVEIDTEKPTIDIGFQEAFPQNCETIYFDEPFTVKAILADNEELGSFNIDIHHNFDHHTHSTEIESCDLGEKKAAVNPYVFIEDYAIPDGLSSYETDLTMTIPSSDGSTQYEEGDYHFHLSVVDQEGWSSQIGLNVKILHR